MQTEEFLYVELGVHYHSQGSCVIDNPSIAQITDIITAIVRPIAMSIFKSHGNFGRSFLIDRILVIRFRFFDTGHPRLHIDIIRSFFILQIDFLIIVIVFILIYFLFLYLCLTIFINANFFDHDSWDFNQLEFFINFLLFDYRIIFIILLRHLLKLFITFNGPEHYCPILTAHTHHQLIIEQQSQITYQSHMSLIALVELIWLISGWIIKQLYHSINTSTYQKLLVLCSPNCANPVSIILRIFYLLMQCK